MKAVDPLIRHYYECFNDRRWEEAASLFTADAVLDVFQSKVQQSATTGFKEFAERWQRAFPDGVLLVNHVEQRNDQTYEVDLTGVGTHLGTLDFGTYRFTPSGARTNIRLRQLFEFREGKIAFSSLSFDIQNFVRQLTRLDRSALKVHLNRIARLSEALEAVSEDSQQEREALEQLGRELDGARRVLRPYFYRD